MNSQGENWDILISTLTLIETNFFVPIVKEINAKGHKAGFILFDESACKLLKKHDIPFYIAAPSSTFDPACPDGKSIVIEQRHPDEIRKIGGLAIAPSDSTVYNPAFDVTPHGLLSGIITENGVESPPK